MPETKTKRIFLSIALTGLIFLAEFIGGLWTGSLALLSDSAHVFMDVFALVLSYLAIRIATRPANDRHTYGYHRMQVLAALANGATLLLISFEILKEAISRFQNPTTITAGPMLIIAVIGLVINVIVALVLREHDHEDLNTRSAFLHVLGDALASVGVIGAGIAIYFTGLTWIDPLVSILISILILFSSGRLLKETIHFGKWYSRGHDSFYGKTIQRKHVGGFTIAYLTVTPGLCGIMRTLFKISVLE